MIEKLPFTEIHTGGENMADLVEYRTVTPYEMQRKINELVDAITRHEDIIRQIGEWGSSKNECLWCENVTKVTLNDPYAEQREWIGKLCRFWYSNKKYADLGILQAITPANTPNKYLKKDSCNWYSNCEPVKPEDDIIYRGE